MIKYLLPLAFTLSLYAKSDAQQYGSFKDSRDGKVYRTVKIMEQLWMAENLNTATFRNGDPIPHAKTAEDWEKAGIEEKPAWCYYDNNPKNGDKYGKLYNWYAVNDPRGLAPKGFHIPSKQEWTVITDYFGGKTVANHTPMAGLHMKSSSGWLDNMNGLNSSGFSGLPGGYRYGNGNFLQIFENGCWWSSSSYPYFKKAYLRTLYHSNNGVSELEYDKDEGLSIRCIRDLK